MRYANRYYTIRRRFQRGYGVQPLVFHHDRVAVSTRAAARSAKRSLEEMSGFPCVIVCTDTYGNERVVR